MQPQTIQREAGGNRSTLARMISMGMETMITSRSVVAQSTAREGKSLNRFSFNKNAPHTAKHKYYQQEQEELFGMVFKHRKKIFFSVRVCVYCDAEER